MKTAIRVGGPMTGGRDPLMRESGTKCTHLDWVAERVARHPVNDLFYSNAGVAPAATEQSPDEGSPL
jgi:hypothetical protein